MKAILFSAIVALAPGMAFAMGGCSGSHDKQAAMSCVDGYVWDSTSETCVLHTTG